MCGIVGFFNPKGFDPASETNQLIRMRDRLTHRGPDDSGIWIDGNKGVALAHRRLSILDLTPAGHQPMKSSTGRFIITYNGEIYNHLELRNELDNDCNISWKGRSDTETILEVIEHKGIEYALNAFIGMFAFALYDFETHRLHLGRDRMGEKPLYYGWLKDTLVFGSELKALSTHNKFQNNLNQNILPAYFRHGYVTNSASIYKDIVKLPPGNLITFNADNRNQHSKPKPYWSLFKTINDCRNNEIINDENEALQLLKLNISTSISRQKISDVPIGAFLSGGIDSSTVVALMQEQSNSKVQTFSIGFTEKDYNEAQYAKKVAEHIGTDHVELYVNSQQSMEIIPKLANLFDEPFGDASAIPTYLVSKLASKAVKVVLSGDGGDELLGGYRRYHNQKSIIAWSMLKHVPSNVLKILQNFNISENFNSLIDRCNYKEFNHFYRRNISQWDDSLLREEYTENASIFEQHIDVMHLTYLQRMMYIDSMTYLPEDILTKVDRSSMANSIETRIPLLDKNVIKCCWSLNDKLLNKNNSHKYILKKLLAEYVPMNLTERPKKGFSVPIDKWIRGPLRGWAEDLLSKQKIEKSGFFNYSEISKKWNEHINGKKNWRDSLWLLLMWQSWYECQ